jgi:hypothetical protein
MLDVRVRTPPPTWLAEEVAVLYGLRGAVAGASLL